MSNIDLLNAFADLRRELATNAELLLKPHGLGPKQMLLLSILSENPSVSSTDLANQTFTDLASVSRALKSLENSGLIVRKSNPQDNRSTRLCLTQDGHIKAQVAQNVRKLIADQFSSSLSQTEQQELLRMLKKSAESLRIQEQKKETSLGRDGSDELALDRTVE